MKKLRNFGFVAIALLLFGVTSCGDEVKDLIEKTITTTLLEQELHFKIGTAVEKVEKDIDLDTPELKEYQKNIKSIKIKEFTYEVTEVKGTKPGKKVNAKFSLDGKVITEEIKLEKSGVIKVKDLETLRDWSDILNSKKKAKFVFEYTSDAEKGTTFKIKVKIKTNVTIGL